MKKYRIHNQSTGLEEEVLTFDEAKILQNRLRQEYYAIIESLFAITVLTENEDGSWTQCLSDSQGEPITQTIDIFKETE